MGGSSIGNVLGWGHLALNLGKFARSFVRGARDEILYFSDAEMTMHCEKAKVLEKCKPWGQHLTLDAINNIGKSIKQKDYLSARDAINSGINDTAAAWCIDALLEAVVLMCTKCATIIAEASPCLYVFK